MANTIVSFCALCEFTEKRTTKWQNDSHLPPKGWVIVVRVEEKERYVQNSMEKGFGLDIGKEYIHVCPNCAASKFNVAPSTQYPHLEDPPSPPYTGRD